MLNDLTPYQQEAIQTVRSRALERKSAAQRDIEAILERQELEPNLLSAATAAMRGGARIGLHFHPERLGRDGVSVAEGLLRTGIYTNQFVAGLSSGSPSAFPGGERDLWEDRLFGGAYHGASVTSGRLPSVEPLRARSHDLVEGEPPLVKESAIDGILLDDGKHRQPCFQTRRKFGSSFSQIGCSVAL